MSDEKKRWDAFRKKNPKIKIAVEEKYLINNREVVSSKYLESLWGVTDRTIRKYVKEGMPIMEESSHHFKVFDLIECISWRMTQIDMGKSNISGVQKKESEKEAAEAEVFIANRNKIIADAKKAGYEADLAKIKLDTATGELISVEDVDKVSAEQAVLHKTDIMNAEKILPTLLENMEKGALAKALRSHNQKRLDDLNELINKEFDCDESLYEIISAALEALKKDNPEEVIEKIRS